MRHNAFLFSLLFAACGGASAGTQPAAEPTQSESSSTAAPGEPAPASGSASDPASVCGLPFEVGHCRAAKRVFAFSLEAGVCEEKIYGGCGGNGNRFENAADCEQLCGCPTGERRVRTCERCGPAGGCEQEVVKCVRECTKPEDCGTEAIHACVNGVCGMACI